MVNKEKAWDFESVTKDIRARAQAAILPDIWHAFTDEVRAQWVRPLMRIGHSNASAAEVLGITSGAVAGVRHREKIPSCNLSTRRNKKKKKRLSDKVVVPTPKKRADSPQKPAAPEYKMAASEATQCKYEGGCGLEREPNSDFCKKHNKKNKR